MKTHKFESTEDAYNATQCDEDVNDGEIIVVESEKVVGVVWTWPFAVTKKAGELHWISDIIDGMVEEIKKFTVERLGEQDQSDLWREAIDAAQTEALRRGWEVKK